MPSPFPGMDPYLEAPDIWPDCHNALAASIRTEMNRDLPRPYYARLEMRPEVGIIGGEPADRSRIIPDVAVVRPRSPAGGRRGRGPDEGGVAVAVAEPPGREVSASIEVGFSDEPIRSGFVEIRDASRDHRLVTLIEILSPANKRGGPDRLVYQRKQQEVIASDANLVEIDLLRGGRRVYADPRLEAVVEALDPRPAYAVVVSESWMRGEVGNIYRVYGFGPREALPCVGIPLREDLPVVPLDLQRAFDRVYDEGPYRLGAVDYAKDPIPPLDLEDAGWAAALLSEAAGPPAPGAGAGAGPG